MVVLVVDKGKIAKPVEQQAEKPALSDSSPACLRVLNKAKLSIRETQFNDDAAVDRMMQQGAEIALETMKEVADKHEIRWWRNGVAFDKAVFRLWESLRESGDVGPVEITRDGSVLIGEDNIYLVGAEEGVKILRRVLEKRWAKLKEKEQLKNLAQDVKNTTITPPPGGQPSYTASAEAAKKNTAPRSSGPVEVPHGGPQWIADDKKKRNAEAKKDEEKEERPG